MKLYIKQKVFSWGAKFRIYDEYENDKYSVEGEVFTFGKKLHLYGLNGNELAYIHQKVWSFLPEESEFLYDLSDIFAVATDKVFG